MRALLTLFIFCGAYALSAQESLWLSDAPSRELGLNITATLAGFFNSGGQGLPADPYMFSLKFSRANRAFRLAAGGRFQRNTEFLNFGDRTTSNQQLEVRSGWEWREPFGTRFTLLWGLDLAGRYREESVVLSSFPQDITVSSREIGLGGGPVLGMMFHLSPRVSFSTESFLYAYYVSGRKEDPADNPADPAVNKSRGVDISPVLPSSLYVIFKF
ncbi:MAG: hypothetical protein KDD19_00340 [Phaeodactylibacter sp.]|nr:hypothetical protein [Phaeodactylibacter sp.]MCB9050265.1 hypothetical protein [Lewinellaceae bacterium]